MLDKKKRLLRRRNRSKYNIYQSNKGNFPIVRLYRTEKNISLECCKSSKDRKVICSSSTTQKVFKNLGLKGYNCQGAKSIGEIMGKKLKDMNINSIIFDRGGHRFHGRVKACLDGILSQISIVKKLQKEDN